MREFRLNVTEQYMLGMCILNQGRRCYHDKRDDLVTVEKLGEALFMLADMYERLGRDKGLFWVDVKRKELTDPF